MEQRPCTLLKSCSGDDDGGGSSSSSSSVSRFGAIWRPLFSGATISPCACGCIYIVGHRRRVTLTSARDCGSGGGGGGGGDGGAGTHEQGKQETVTWKIKVRKVMISKRYCLITIEE